MRISWTFFFPIFNKFSCDSWQSLRRRQVAVDGTITGKHYDRFRGWLVSLFVSFFFGRKYPISRMRISLTGTRHSSARPEGDRASEFRCRTKLSVTGPDGTSSVWASVCACVCVCSSRSRFIFRNSRSVCIEGDTIGTWVWARAGLFGKPVWFHSKTDQMYGQCQAKSPWVGPSILCRNGDTRGPSHKHLEQIVTCSTFPFFFAQFSSLSNLEQMTTKEDEASVMDGWRMGLHPKLINKSDAIQDGYESWTVTQHAGNPVRLPLWFVS